MDYLKNEIVGFDEKCILSMICVTEWSPLLHSLENDL